MKRVTCPKCKTAIIYQINEQTKENGLIEVTYTCIGCKIDFSMKFVN
jgi:RNase P subunit RPR2